MFDFTPLYRSTVGFDRMFRLLDGAAAHEASSYPPYNIERLGENAFRISMAVAGFAPEDVAIEVRQNALTITGKKAEKSDEKIDLLHQGIAARAFERRFQLADHVEVTGAELLNGLLHIALRREIPEAAKPRMIPVQVGAQPAAPRVIESQAAA